MAKTKTEKKDGKPKTPSQGSGSGSSGQSSGSNSGSGSSSGQSSGATTPSAGVKYTLNVNGQSYAVTVSSADMPLLWVLRDKLGLTGTKYGCGIEICGACTVLVNGKPEKSCDMSVKEAVGRKITTIEGIAATANGAKAQAAWVAHQVPQCGFCQSGMLVSATAAMNAGKKGAAIVPQLRNLCVCGTYARVKDAAKTL